MHDDPQEAAYAVFRGEFEAWHFCTKGSTQTATQPIFVPTSPDTESEFES